MSASAVAALAGLALMSVGIAVLAGVAAAAIVAGLCLVLFSICVSITGF